MFRATDSEEAAKDTVRQLLVALQDRDASTYHALLCRSDREFMTVPALEENITAMSEITGKLLDFSIEGVVLHAEADHAAVYVSLNFEGIPAGSELYNLTIEDGHWRMCFDFAELAGGS